MKLIIGFDSWTTGSFHYEKLVTAFEKKGYQLLLIHIGSWGHDKNRPKEEYIGKLKVRDISYYADQSFSGILIKEKPEAVIFLSTRAFAHQAFNRYANHLNIPTVHLAHGLVGVQDVGLEHKTHKTSYSLLLSIWTQRISKNLFRLIPCYIQSLLATRASLYEWQSFGKELIYKGFAKNNKNISPPLDVATSAGLVYTRADIPFFRDGHHINEKDIYIVGNPDLSRFELHHDNFGIGLQLGSTENNEIIYIDTALVQAGFVFQDEAEYINHLHSTYQKLVAQGFHMIVKLHPAHFKSGVPAALNQLGIEICQNADFVSRLKKSTAAIVEPSSAAMIPALMGKPVLLAQYEKLSEQRYGAVLTNYPRARFLKDLEDTTGVLETENSELNYIAFKEWFNENSGPLPAEDMPHRVVEAVSKVIEEPKRFVKKIEC
jgi:hypothetical protein